MHFENDHLLPLMPHFIKSAAKGLACIQEGKKHYETDIVSVYASEVLDRVCEIDRAFEGLEISIEYLAQTDFGSSKYDFPALHSFHVENFIFRLTGVSDRCWLLIGSSLLLKKGVIECLKGKHKIRQEMAGFPKIESSIETIDAIVRKFRSERNDIAHNSGYSNKNIGILVAIEQFDIAVDDIAGANKYVIDDSIELLKPTVDELSDAVTNLISSLSFIYEHILIQKEKNT